MWTDWGIGVIVDAGRSQLAALTPNVDGDPGLRRQLRLAPPHDVVLQRARALLVEDCAVLERDAAVVGEQPLVEGAQAVGASVDVLPGALDASAHRVVKLGLAGERVDQRSGLPRDQPCEVGHTGELVPTPGVLEVRARRR
jgi:hypothetical protein